MKDPALVEALKVQAQRAALAMEDLRTASDALARFDPPLQRLAVLRQQERIASLVEGPGVADALAQSLREPRQAGVAAPSHATAKARTGSAVDAADWRRWFASGEQPQKDTQTVPRDESTPEVRRTRGVAAAPEEAASRRGTAAETNTGGMRMRVLRAPADEAGRTAFERELQIAAAEARPSAWAPGEAHNERQAAFPEVTRTDAQRVLGARFQAAGVAEAFAAPVRFGVSPGDGTTPVTRLVGDTPEFPEVPSPQAASAGAVDAATTIQRRLAQAVAGVERVQGERRRAEAEQKPRGVRWTAVEGEEESPAPLPYRIGPETTGLRRLAALAGPVERVVTRVPAAELPPAAPAASAAGPIPYEEDDFAERVAELLRSEARRYGIDTEGVLR